MGAAGALVDVSSYARLDDGLLRRWGRDDAFSDLEPGTFSFVLDNADGRFTPENPFSGLVTKLSEGARACVSVGGRLTAGTVRSVEPEFPGGSAAWATVRVTCDDMLGTAARTRFTSLADQLVEAAGVYGFWKFADDATSSVAVDSGPLGLPPFRASSVDGYVPTFGAAALPWVGDAQARGGGSGSIDRLFSCDLSGRTFSYSSGSGGAYGLWVTPITSTTDATDYCRIVIFTNGAGNIILNVRTAVTGQLTGAGTEAFGPSVVSGTPVYVAAECDYDGTTFTTRFYADNVLFATRSKVIAGLSAFDISPRLIQFEMRSSLSFSDFLASRLSHTDRSPAEYLARDATTLNAAVEYVQAASDGVTFDTLPALWDAPVQIGDVSDASALDLLNAVLLTEQGHAYTVTSGTLTNPTETVVVRDRDRPTTVTQSFDVERELQGAPGFVRDLTNLVSSVRVGSEVREVTVADSSLVARAGNASDRATVLVTRDFDMRAWGEDRIDRGANSLMRIASVVVDAMTTPTDRSAALLALIPGDRVRFTNLPSTILGFTTWDGWFLGARETHTTEAHQFELYFTPVLPDTAVYDTDRYVDEVLTLSGNINAAVTSINIATTGDKLTTTDLPLTVQIDNEQLTVTACTSATPQVATVTRGVNGTTAASHTSGAAVTVLPDSIYAF